MTAFNVTKPQAVIWPLTIDCCEHNDDYASNNTASGNLAFNRAYVDDFGYEEGDSLQNRKR